MTYSTSVRLSCCLIVFVFTVFFGFAACAANQVGYINTQRLIHESKIGKVAKQDLQKLRTEKEKEVVDKRKEAEQLKEYIVNKKDWSGPDEKKEALEKYQKLAKEYDRLVEDAKEEIARQDRDLTAKILEKADGALKEVAKRKKFTIILKDANVIGYLDPDVDITDDVLDILNKGE